jgi:hypothetical protein
MTHAEKIEILLKDLTQRGVRQYTVAPPLYRLLWRLGIEATPPHFASFWALVLAMGGFFAIAWGILMWVTLWRGEDMSVAVGIGVSIMAGLLFGLIMAAYYRWSAGRLALPRWEDYPTKT